MRFIIASAIIAWLIFAVKMLKNLESETIYIKTMSVNTPLDNPNQDTPKSDHDLQRLFGMCFYDTFNTRLQGDAPEPLFIPASVEKKSNTIFYRHDYFSSALHEIAHWCIAGDKRRQQIDYGYWYAPDGRTSQQQIDFERFECKPQALERAFSMACNIPFRVSVDNLSAQDNHDEDALASQLSNFAQAVNTQLMRYLEHGFPERAGIFLTSLHGFYATLPLSLEDKRLAIDSHITSSGL
jgi:elongation factor P hydroxylase